MPSSISGGVPSSAIVMLTGEAGPGGANVALSSDTASVVPPASVAIPAGAYSTTINVPTLSVSTSTPATVTGTLNGVTAQAHFTLTPQAPPTSITLNPSGLPFNGWYGSSGTVTIATPQSTDEELALTSSNPNVALVNNFVTIPAGATAGGFCIQAYPVSTSTPVTMR